jgi:hypothetical protein
LNHENSLTACDFQDATDEEHQQAFVRVKEIASGVQYGNVRFDLLLLNITELDFARP